MNDIFNDLKIINKHTQSKKPPFEQKLKIYGTPNNKLFVSYYKHFINKSEADEYFLLFEQLIKYNSSSESMIKIFGKSIPIPRKQVAFGEKGTFYNFSGIKVNAIDWNSNDKLSKIFKILRDKIKLYFSVDFNFVLINKYETGHNYIGYHSDDEKDLIHDSPIVGITFGAERDFIFKHTYTSEKTSLILHHGSCICMHYPTNKFWKHSVPKRQNVNCPRISLTFRCMKT